MNEKIPLPESNNESEIKVLARLLKEKGLGPEFSEAAEMWKMKREAEIRVEFPGISEGVDPIQLIAEQAEVFAAAEDFEGAISFYEDTLLRVQDSTRDPQLTDDFIDLTHDKIDGLKQKIGL